VVADWSGLTDKLLKVLLPSGEEKSENSQAEKLLDLLKNDRLSKMADRKLRNQLLMELIGTVYKLSPAQSVLRLVSPERYISQEEVREMLEELDLPESDETVEKLLKNVVLGISNLA
jgi:hypothetical protein